MVIRFEFFIIFWICDVDNVVFIMICFVFRFIVNDLMFDVIKEIVMIIIISVY